MLEEKLFGFLLSSVQVIIRNNALLHTGVSQFLQHSQGFDSHPGYVHAFRLLNKLLYTDIL